MSTYLLRPQLWTSRFFVDCIAPDSYAMNITSPRQLITAVRDLVGANSTESIILIALDDGQIASKLVIGEVSEQAIGAQLYEYMSAHDFSEASQMVAIANMIDRQQAQHLLALVQSIANARDVHVLDLLHVSADRWRSVLCGDEDCCPDLGHLLENGAKQTPDGVHDETEFEDEIHDSERLVSADLDSATMDALDLALRNLPQWPDTTPTEMLPWRNEVVEQVVNILSGQLEEPIAATALVSIALNDIRARDGVLRKVLESEVARPQICENLILIYAAAKHEHRAAIATTYAGTVWLSGRRALARHAIDVALELDAQYSLARLLDTALVHGIPHRVWVDSLSAVDYEKCLAGAA